jgi:hypothetical protein
MDQITFDRYARRAAGLLDRRSLFGSLSGALLSAGLVPFEGNAKKKGNKKSKGCKKRMKLCRTDLRDDVCEGNDGCITELNRCCKKACQSLNKAVDCCENAGWCA